MLFRSDGCEGNSFQYKIATVCTDGKAEAEFMLFGDKGEAVVGKQVGAILRSQPTNDEFPADVQAIVQKKYTWNFKLTSRSFFNRRKSFQVESIDVCLGRQPMIPTVPAIMSLAFVQLPLLEANSQVADSSASTHDGVEVRKFRPHTIHMF